MLQVGARNMQNFDLLREVGQTGRPVLLKRGMSATIEEWLLPPSTSLARATPTVVLCERGIRTFETAYPQHARHLGACRCVKQQTHLPVIVDPSHGERASATWSRRWRARRSPPAPTA